MGIRFLCQHCEKRLNVKATQAGQEGQCPHCLGRVTVPDISSMPNAPDKEFRVPQHDRRKNVPDDSAIALHSVDEQITMDGIPAENRHLEDLPKPKRADDALTDFDSAREPAEVFTLDKPQLPATIGKIDPIAEAPTRVWYFRSREWGEKGPLKGKAMQEYLDRGEVKIGCIVWREDWNDWLPAERVFPSLVAEAKEKRQKARVRRAFKEANYKLPDAWDPQAELKNRKRRKNRIFIGAIATGILIIILLLFVLLRLVANNP